MASPTPIFIGGLPTLTINGLANYSGSFDPANDLFAVYQNSSTSTVNVNRNTALGISSAPVGINDAQTLSNKTVSNTNTITIKDSSLTIQNASSITKQFQFLASGITTGQTRIYTVPDYNATFATLSGTETLTNKTLTSPTLTNATLTNATLTADSISGFTTSNNGTIYGISVTGGTIGSAALANNSVTTSAITNGSVTPSKLSNSSTEAVVNTSESTATQSYTDLTTSGPAVTVTIGANGLALVTLQCQLLNTTASSQTWASFVVSGANTIAATDATAIMIIAYATNAVSQLGTAILLTGLTPGSTTFKMQYRVNANTGTFSNRRISVIPL